MGSSGSSGYSVAKFKPYFATSKAHSPFTLADSKLSDFQKDSELKWKSKLCSGQWARFGDLNLTKGRTPISLEQAALGNPSLHIHESNQEQMESEQSEEPERRLAPRSH